MMCCHIIAQTGDLRKDWCKLISHSCNVALPMLPHCPPHQFCFMLRVVYSSNLQWLHFALRIDAIPLRYVSPMKETFPLHELVCAEMSTTKEASLFQVDTTISFKGFGDTLDIDVFFCLCGVFHFRYFLLVWCIFSLLISNSHSPFIPPKRS